jgi:hypothetical protein
MAANIIGVSRPGYTVSVNGVRQNATVTPKPIPAGGKEGDALVKLSDADYDVGWMEINVLMNALRNADGHFLRAADGSILINDNPNITT